MNAASIVVVLDRKTLDELRALARSKGSTLGDLVREAIADYLGRPEHERSACDRHAC